MCLHARKQLADVLFVVTKQGERGPESVVHAFHNLSEVLGYLLKKSENVRIAVLLGGLVLRHNEGPPGKRIARPREPFYDHLLVWGYCAREILTRAQQPIQREENGGGSARA